MQSSSPTLSERLLSLLLRLAPLLLAGLLLGWLSGGFPPTNWRLLAQTLLHLSTYRAAQGSSVILPLLLLGGQALLLALSWIWLVVLLMRTLFAPSSGPARTPPAVVPLPLPVNTRKEFDPLDNPFKEASRQRHQNGTITLGKAASSKSEAQDEGTVATPSPSPPRRSVPDLSKPRPVAPRPSASLRVGSPPGDPFDVQPDILALFDQPDLLTSSLSPGDRWGEADEAEGRQPPRADESLTHDFRFGNPFDGPLPDVFEYDADLKQSLSDLKGNTPGPEKP